jgi:hypothetical protein
MTEEALIWVRYLLEASFKSLANSSTESRVAWSLPVSQVRRQKFRLRTFDKPWVRWS